MRARGVVAAASALACVCLGAAVSSASTGTPRFTAQRPLPPAPGDEVQIDGEPGMGTTPDGQVWVASNLGNPGATSPTRVFGGDVWTSRDGGRTYRWVAQPFVVAGGEDTDLAVAPEKSSSGHYAVYAASLTIADSSLAWSTDGGATLTMTPISGTPLQDRPWLAADGPCTVYVAYHSPLLLPTDGSSTQVTTVDTCDPSRVRATAVIGGDVDTVVGGVTNPQFGKPTVDTSPRSPHRHAVYLPMQQCHAPTGATLADDLTATSGGEPSCGDPSVNLVAISTDGGTTFTVRRVSTGSRSMAIWPATVATDSAGTVYYAWTDSVHAYLNTSRDGGRTWSPSRRLDTGAVRAAVYPTVTAGRAGRVDVAMYGTDRSGRSDQPADGTPGADGAAPWRVWVARSTDGGRTTKLFAVSDVVHRGRLCTFGSACPGDGSRNLLDDFGASLSPRTGLLNVVFTSDLRGGRVVTPYTAYVSER